MLPALHKPARKPSLGDGLGLHSMRKAASCEPLFKETLALSDDESYRGGARFETASDTLSPSSKTRAHPKKPLSDDGTPISTRSSNFMVGSSEDGDVFTDGSNDDFRGASSPHGRAQVAVYEEQRDRVDPQTMYAGSSCMFVANLPQQFSDRRLEEEVTKAFSQFGIVFVKIKRDGRGMPFAFCQYTNDHDAQAAMGMGKGMMILERPCRTEMARAHSSFIVYKNSGQRIRLGEARDLLRRLGEIAKTEYLHEGLRLLARLPQTVIVTYKMYDPRRDPPRVFANDQTFCVKIYDPKALSSHENVPTADPREGVFLKQYDRDRRSAYAGNLPPSMTKDLLKSLGSSCGEVLDVQLYLKEVPGGNGQKTCFGFLEFSRPDMPEEFVEAMHNTEIDGYRIRVERKQSRNGEPPRLAQHPGGEIAHSRLSMRRARVGSCELASPSDGQFGTSPGSMGRPSRRKTFASSSYAPGRSRHTRTTILGSDASPAACIFEPPLAVFTASPCRSTGSPDADSFEAAGTSAKKSVDFDLTDRTVSDSSSGSESDAEAVKMTPKPTTPKTIGVFTASPAERESASRGNETHPVPPTTIPWMPPYPPYGYPYLGAPMTPQANPAMMYAGYMQPQMYHPMFDVYGNMMVSPTHMMPAFGAAPVSTDTPARSDYGDKATDEPDKYTAEGNK